MCYRKPLVVSEVETDQTRTCRLWLEWVMTFLKNWLVL